MGIDKDPNYQVKRTTEGLSEDLRKETIKQRPRRSTKDRQEKKFEPLKNEDQGREASKMRKKGKAEEFTLLQPFEEGEEQFAHKIAKKALSSDGESVTDFAGKLSEVEAKEKGPQFTLEPKEAPKAATSMIAEKTVESIEAPVENPRQKEAVKQPIAKDPTPPTDKPKEPVAENKSAPTIKDPLPREQPAENVTKIAEPIKEKPAVQSPIAPTEQPNTPIAQITQTKDSVPIPKQDIEVIMKQMVEHIQRLERGDLKETTLVLRHPPLFQGVQIKIIQHESAPGEFNVSFSNLSPKAKELIDQPINQEALKTDLQTKGFALHIITTSQDPMNEMVASSGRPGFGERDEEKQQKREQEQETPEEET